jgi:hypothetical protein
MDVRGDSRRSCGDEVLNDEFIFPRILDSPHKDEAFAIDGVFNRVTGMRHCDPPKNGTLF